jgi:hypothetical protein
MVLFLFVIMLLNLEKEENHHPALAENLRGFSRSRSARSDRIGFSFHFSDGGKGLLPPQSGRPGQYGGGCPAPVHRFPVAFEITSVLLLVAIIGAIILAKREI